MTEYDKAKLDAALNRVAATGDGRLVLHALMTQCHWNDTYVASDSGEATIYHAARRGVYGGLRKSIRPEYLKVIEFDYQQTVEKKEDGTSSSSTKRTSRPGTKRT